MEAAQSNPRMIMREQPMKLFQWVAVSLCVAMTALDGFDVLAVAFVGPELRGEWDIGATEIAALVSAGLFGMVTGSLIFSPIADVVGRRNVLLISLAIITVGMFASAFTTSVDELLPLRFFTGFGIGTMFAPVNSMAAEFSSMKRRGLAIGLNVLGYPLGTTIGGLIATWMLAENGLNLGWPSVFFLGAGLTAALIPLLLLFMPESMDFLLSKRPKNALPKINIIMMKLGRAPLAELPPPDEEAKMAGGLLQILKQPYLARVVIVIASYFMTISAFYFSAGLTTTILAQEGFNPSLSRVGGILITVGGMLGSLTFGLLSARIPFRHLTTIVCVLAVGSTSVFGLLGFNVYALFAGAIVMGFFINSAIAGFYTGMAAGFPAHLRATGTGFTLGIGRFGAIIGPLVGGVLFDAGLEFGWVYLVVGLPMLLSALFMQMLGVERKGAVASDDVTAGFITTGCGFALGALVFFFRPLGVLEDAMARVGDFTLRTPMFYGLMLLAALMVLGGVYLAVRPKGSQARTQAVA
jgi:benzoate transport